MAFGSCQCYNLFDFPLFLFVLLISIFFCMSKSPSHPLFKNEATCLFNKVSIFLDILVFFNKHIFCVVVLSTVILHCH